MAKSKRDIPLDQAIALVRAAQKINCDTGEELHAAMAARVAEIHLERNRRNDAERALQRILDLPHTSDIKTAQHFARLGLPRRKRRL